MLLDHAAQTIHLLCTDRRRRTATNINGCQFLLGITFRNILHFLFHCIQISIDLILINTDRIRGKGAVQTSRRTKRYADIQAVFISLIDRLDNCFLTSGDLHTGFCLFPACHISFLIQLLYLLICTSTFYRFHCNLHRTYAGQTTPWQNSSGSL